LTKWQDSLMIQAAVPTELSKDRIVSIDTDGVWEVSRSIANASSLDGTRGDDLVQDLVDRGLVTCTAMFTACHAVSLMSEARVC